MTSGHDDAMYRMVSADHIAGSNPAAERVGLAPGIRTPNGLLLHLRRVAPRATILKMIRSFRHKDVERFFKSGSRAGIQAAHAPRLARQLSALDAATRPEDMNRPGWDWHPLKGGLFGH